MTQDNQTPVPTIPLPDEIYFSASDNAFYAGYFYLRYVAAGSWPVDAKKVTEEQFKTFSGKPPTGKVRGTDTEGNPYWIPAPPLTTMQARDLLNARLNNALDYVAREWGYDKGIDNATTWATSSNPQFAAEGKALLDWRDAVWAWAAAQPDGTTSREGMPQPPARPNVNSQGTGASQ